MLELGIIDSELENEKKWTMLSLCDENKESMEKCDGMSYFYV